MTLERKRSSRQECSAGNTGLEKVADHYTADTFVVKIATFDKPEKCNQ